MENCLVTKLKEEVDNFDLLKLGEMRFTTGIRHTTSGDKVRIKSSERQTMYFYLDGVLQGYQTIPAGDVGTETSPTVGTVISITDKYSITEISETVNNKVTINIDFFKYNTVLNKLEFHGGEASGDLSSLSNNTDMTTLYLGPSVDNKSLTGDLSSLSSMSHLSILNLTRSSVSGDLSSLPNKSGLTSLSLTFTSITGDTSTIAQMTSLQTLRIGGTGISGNLGDLSVLTNLSELSLTNNITYTTAQGDAIDAILSNNGATTTYNHTENGSTVSRYFNGGTWIS